MRNYVPTPVIVAILAALCAAPGCTPSTRATALTTAELGVNTASAAFVAYDKQRETAIAMAAKLASERATSFEEGKAAIAQGRSNLDAYVASRAAIDRAIVTAYLAIAAATTVNDDTSLVGAQKALKQLVDLVTAFTGTAERGAP